MPTVAVLNALRQAEPDMRLRRMTRLLRAAFSQRLVGEFVLIDRGAEFGKLRDGPFNTCAEESFAGYQARLRHLCRGGLQRDPAAEDAGPAKRQRRSRDGDRRVMALAPQGTRNLAFAGAGGGAGQQRLYRAC